MSSYSSDHPQEVRLSLPNLVYMCTKVAYNPVHSFITNTTGGFVTQHEAPAWIRRLTEAQLSKMAPPNYSD